MMRTWERAIRRAALPLVYTHGFSPHARISLAAPLPVGVVGRRELMDMWLDPSIATDAAAERLRSAMPPGLEVIAVEEVSDALPSLQSLLRAARYDVLLPPSVDIVAAREQLATLLALGSLDWEEERGDKTRRYDLRSTILDIQFNDATAQRPASLDMHLSLAEGRTGRPAQVLLAMGIDPDGFEITRTMVELDDAARVVVSTPVPARDLP
jgi:radical SAM-linked protein